MHACLTALRMQAARALLAAGRPVAETARATGSASVSHFGKTFRQHTGSAPKAWALACQRQAMDRLAEQSADRPPGRMHA